ncbi:MAG: hypothetical protein FJY73_08775 [Candidatus Eisenbacteria bacterium]|nr:hypothetical protein [Candidatus Eisenbacteria bacterium]
MKGRIAVLRFVRFLLILISLRAGEILLGVLPVGIASSIDLFVLYVVLRSARRGVMEGVLFGLAAGLFRDLVSLQTVGTDLLPLAAAGAFSSWAHRQVVGESAPGLFLILAGAVLAHDLAGGLGLLVEEKGGWVLAERLVFRALPAGLATGALGVLFHETLRARRRAGRREVAA